jgi:hypothetical protein
MSKACARKEWSYESFCEQQVPTEQKWVANPHHCAVLVSLPSVIVFQGKYIRATDDKTVMAKKLGKFILRSVGDDESNLKVVNGKAVQDYNIRESWVGC